MKVQIPFQQLLNLVRALTPAQKIKLKQELADVPLTKPDRDTDFTELLLNGPVFSKKQIRTIEENRKSIAKWRTKN